MKCLFVIILCLLSTSAFAQDAAPLHRAEKVITDVMVHDIFSPPVASRIYLYTNIAAYEVLVRTFHGTHRSLHGQIKAFPNIPAPIERIDGSLAAVYAYMTVGKRLIFSEATLDDSLRLILRMYKGVHKTVYNASLQYGRQAADSILVCVVLVLFLFLRKLPR